jgi:hypothetical protein
MCNDFVTISVANAAPCGLLHQFINVTDTVLFNLSGLSALSGDTSAAPLITRGLLLEDPNNPGTVVLYAGLASAFPAGDFGWDHQRMVS